MYRKKKTDQYVQPMPKRRFLELMREFKALGGQYVCSEESEAHLIKANAEASALDGYTILFRRRPSRSAVYEELFHTQQYRDGKIDGTIKNRLECEIEAQLYLLENSERFELTKPEIDQTKRALETYKIELSKMKGEES